MHHHAPIPAAQLHLSLNAFSAPYLSGEERNGSGDRPSTTGTLTSSFELGFLRSLIHLDYSFLEEVATHYANGDENAQQSDDEIVLAALNDTADEKLTGLALRLVLSDHVGIPRDGEPDLLAEAETAFVPKKPKAVKGKTPVKAKPTAVKAPQKKESARKKAA